MTKNVVAKTMRGTFTAISLATLLMATASPAHATGGFWSWWQQNTPSWWPIKPAAVSTPEIDAGLARSAAAILAGGLVVMRSRKKRQG